MASGNPILSGLAVIIIAGIAKFVWNRLHQLSQPVRTMIESEPREVERQTAEADLHKYQGAQNASPVPARKGHPLEDYDEIRAHYKGLPPLSQSEFIENIIGVNVDWEGRLYSAKKTKAGILNLTMDVGKNGTVNFETSYTGHEFIAAAKHGDMFRIQGNISKFYSIDYLILADVTITRIST